MIKDASFGVIPLRFHEGILEVLLVFHTRGKYWGFPKGHKEGTETSQQAAERELQEETGLHVVSYAQSHPLVENYRFYTAQGLVSKRVEYFIAFVQGELALQAREIAEARWIPLPQASALASFPEARSMCMQVAKLVSY